MEFGLGRYPQRQSAGRSGPSSDRIIRSGPGSICGKVPVCARHRPPAHPHPKRVFASPCRAGWPPARRCAWY